MVFVRHGETEVNAGGRLQGRVDAPLTSRGQVQADRTAATLATGPRPDRVLTSPLERARATAEAIGRACEVAVEVDDRLVELDYGEWEGRSLAEVSVEEWAAWRSDPEYAPPGGESLRSVTRRVASLCDEVLALPGLSVAVSHVSPIKAAVVWALGADEALTWRMHLELASITRVGRRGAGPAYLASFNETAHLLGPAA